MVTAPVPSVPLVRPAPIWSTPSATNVVPL
jgi:hypothetical protein